MSFLARSKKLASHTKGLTVFAVVVILSLFILCNILLNVTLLAQYLPEIRPTPVMPIFPSTRIILHVTKEFKPIASVGGVGSVAGGLSHAQSKIYTTHDVWVVMPHYSFISEPSTEFHTVTVEHAYTTVKAKLRFMKHGNVNIVLVGPGDRAPFDLLWKGTETEIYATEHPLTYSHRDVFFSSCVLGLVAHLQTTRDVEVVHIHGSTNGLLPGLIMEKIPPKERPSTVYTLHDYVYEPDVMLDKTVTMEFPLVAQVITSMGLANEPNFFPCKLAILKADMITAVSDGMVQGILIGEIPFPFRDAMVKRYFSGEFVGIPNSMEPELNPFKNKQLLDNQISFSYDQPISITKKKAKRALFPTILPSASLPLVVFVGRLDYMKGIDTFERMATLSSTLNFQFVIVGSYTVGQKDTWEFIKKTILRFENVRVIDTPAGQKKFGLMIRAAADFMFVPSKMESFGLVAVEACKYGAIPVVTDVPGLRTVVVDYYKDTSPDEDQWTGFIFNQKSRPLEDVMETAMQVYSKLDTTQVNALLKRLSLSHLDWEEVFEGTAHSPVTLYMSVYKEVREKRINPNALPKHSEELVSNGSFDYLERGETPPWKHYYEGYITSPILGRTDYFSIITSNVACNGPVLSMGATQKVHLNQKKAEMILVSGWSRAENVVLMQHDQSLYSLFVDVFFMDGSSSFGNFVAFSPGTHVWEYRQQYLYFEKPIQFVTVTCRFVNSCGTAYFDDISLISKK